MDGCEAHFKTSHMYTGDLLLAMATVKSVKRCHTITELLDVVFVVFVQV